MPCPAQRSTELVWAMTWEAMMVFGPGGYRVRDFVRVGLPLVALWFGITMLVVPGVWF
jgi:di/tricarboxylate transporter